jgi:hypothetical protein
VLEEAARSEPLSVSVADGIRCGDEEFVTWMGGSAATVSEYLSPCKLWRKALLLLDSTSMILGAAAEHEVNPEAGYRWAL